MTLESQDKPEQDKEIEAVVRDFREKLEDAHVNIYEEGPSLFTWLRATLRSYGSKEYERGRKEGSEATKAAAIEKIGAIKGKVQTISGSYKYDSCYDDCINVLKSLPVDEVGLEGEMKLKLH